MLMNSKALNFEFYEFIHFLKAENDQINQMQWPTVAKITTMPELELLDSLQLISRKI